MNCLKKIEMLASASITRLTFWWKLYFKEILCIYKYIQDIERKENPFMYAEICIFIKILQIGRHFLRGQMLKIS